MCLACLLCASTVDAQGRSRGGGGFRFGGDSGDGGGGGFRFGGDNGRGGSDGGGFRFGGDNSGGSSGGGFGFGGDFIQRMDENGNGRLDEDEVPERMRDMLQSQGLDVSGGISFEDFESAREGLRSEFEGGRGFGFGDRSRGDSGRDSRSSSQRYGDSSDDRKETKPRPPVIFNLPASHAAADADGDGQLGMYEWRRWSGHSLKEFFDLDGNSDGFVTAREVYMVIGFPNLDQNSGGSSRPAEAVASVITVPGGGQPVLSGSSGSSDSSDRLTSEATRYFGILDKDEDGAISAEEWGSSIRIRGMFEKGGLDLTQPMPQDTFVQNYITLSNAEG